jgi:hypothetical protein
MLGEPLNNSYYLLGCCQFFHRDFINKLNEIDFFDRFLNLTNGFTRNFPNYNGYDISEHMYPSLCRHFGGNIGVLSTCDEFGKWHGSYQYYPVRWRPDISEIDEFKNASIIHPVKSFENPIREFHRKKRFSADIKIL